VHDAAGVPSLRRRQPPAMADEQLRRDGLLGESVHLARERARQTGAGGEPEPEPESEPGAEEPPARVAEVAGLAGGIREMVRCALPRHAPLVLQRSCATG
jgi:hypothetical protein